VSLKTSTNSGGISFGFATTINIQILHILLTTNYDYRLAPRWGVKLMKRLQLWCDCDSTAVRRRTSVERRRIEVKS